MAHLYLKKSLGQHFLKDENMLLKIADAIGNLSDFKTVVEIGPGMGALTKHLLAQNPGNFYVVELDDRWAEHLNNAYPALRGHIIHEDFLRTDLGFLQNPAHVVGNFPYNISTQIVFKILEHRQIVERMTGMFQKEVALRIAAKPGSKDYGVMSVLAQAWYEGEYLFDVPPGCFNPPPKVMSGIIRLKRKNGFVLGCDENMFKRVVKAAFNQRRKTMRNSLKEVVSDKALLASAVFEKRPEQLSVQEFVELVNRIQ
ncbi:MAG TPA: 16S rRNA (adenine(1518)-N(6)/adenine(1519)-N(6))-dimethyltransferase RsmA [Chitinophagales bacterium]|nr:16S rRNA (adenine(1518)-N(6)/adenine(1519)-N(6))-dimethyltransferase RsmA [Chitinophagales bacterium]